MVVAIIGILASMLLPALNQAREKARQAVCMGKLKQIGLAFMMYLDDNDEWFPFAAADVRDSEGRAYGCWTGTLYPYVQNKKVYICPSDKDNLVDWRGAPESYESNYGYNIGFGYDTVNYPPYQTTVNYYWRKLPRIRKPSSVVLVVDQHGGTTGAISSTSVYVHFRHSSLANVLFADGHVAPVNKATVDASSCEEFAWNPHWSGN